MKIKIQTYKEEVDGIPARQEWLISFTENGKITSFRLTPEEMFDLEKELDRNRPRTK